MSNIRLIIREESDRLIHPSQGKVGGALCDLCMKGVKGKQVGILHDLVTVLKGAAVQHVTGAQVFYIDTCNALGRRMAANTFQSGNLPFILVQAPRRQTTSNWSYGGKNVFQIIYKKSFCNLGSSTSFCLMQESGCGSEKG